MTIPIALSIVLSTSCSSPSPAIAPRIDDVSLHRAICILELIHAADYSLAQEELRRFEREHAAHGDLALLLDQWCDLQSSGSTAARQRQMPERAPSGAGPDLAPDRDRLRELRQKGMTHYSKGRVEEAIACWEQVIAVDPADGETAALLRRARAVLENEKKIQKAGPPASAAERGGKTAEADPAAGGR